MATEIAMLYERALADLAFLQAELQQAGDGAKAVRLAVHLNVVRQRAVWYRKRLKMRRPAWVRAKLTAQAQAVCEGRRRVSVASSIGSGLDPALSSHIVLPPAGLIDG